jgi:hypothetical protein
LLHDRGLSIVSDAGQARAYCASSAQFKGSGARSALIRWESADVTQLPAYLAQRVASGEYRAAAVGSCPAQSADGTFTVHRVAVLLYGTDTAALP